MADTNILNTTDLATTEASFRKAGFDEDMLEDVMARLAKAKHPKRIANALFESKKVGLLDTPNSKINKANVDAIFNHQDPQKRRQSSNHQKKIISNLSNQRIPGYQ